MTSPIYKIAEDTQLNMAPPPDARLPRTLSTVEPDRPTQVEAPPSRSKAGAFLIAFALFVLSYYLIRRFVQ